MNRYYAEVSNRAGHRCEYCKAPEVVFNFPFEVEQIIPPCAGGDDFDSTCRPSWRPANIGIDSAFIPAEPMEHSGF